MAKDMVLDDQDIMPWRKWSAGAMLASLGKSMEANEVDGISKKVRLI